MTGRRRFLVKNQLSFFCFSSGVVSKLHFLERYMLEWWTLKGAVQQHTRNRLSVNSLPKVATADSLVSGSYSQS